jgi:hypothetical protein
MSALRDARDLAHRRARVLIQVAREWITGGHIENAGLCLRQARRELVKAMALRV